jgi:hypothetical protein
MTWRRDLSAHREQIRPCPEHPGKYGSLPLKRPKERQCTCRSLDSLRSLGIRRSLGMTLSALGMTVDRRRVASRITASPHIRIR